MVIYLFGADIKRARQHIEKLVEKFYRERDPQKLNVKRLAAAECDGSQIQTELMSAPFLAPKRMVVVERMLEHGDEEVLKWFEGRFLDQEPPSDVIVVLWEEEPVKHAKTAVEALHARLTQSKFAQEFAPLEGKKREDWVVRRVIESSGAITAEAASELHRRIADDFELSNTIDQLVAYAGGKTITNKELELFLPPDIENKIFDAMDQLASQNRTTAMRLLAQVWYVDNDPVYIFAMLHRQVRMMMEAHDLLADNPQMGEQALAKTLGVHGFIARKLMQQVPKWTRAQLVGWYDRLIEIDYAIKHGSSDPRVLIDKFVAA